LVAHAAIAKSSQDIHTDMGEFVAWSREAGLGTPKHPPLGAWLLRAWFGVFPRENWAYYCFAVLLPTLALWITWRLAARYLPPDKRVAGIVLLTFVPFYNFHAIKFNANTVLTPFWALATLWFLRSFETCRIGWAVLAGIAAAAAMLSKYWSITLLAGLGVAALSDPRRTAYFNSSAPYVTLAVGTVLLTPHRAHRPTATHRRQYHFRQRHCVLLQETAVDARYRQSKSHSVGECRPHPARRRGYRLSGDGCLLRAYAARLHRVL
jgi:4-amino-4-deoxy-L-arabinose transferase-like glycosyltransferase